MFRIAVLIACHNRKLKTLSCLENLSNQENIDDKLKIDIFLLDDASNDGTSEEIHLRFPNVKVFKGDGNLFWNRGMHMAWKEASKFHYDGYVWLNDDTILYKNALEILFLAMIQTNYNSIICGSIESPVEPGVITYGGGNKRNGHFSINYPKGVIEKCDIINGNCVLVPASVFEIVGNLDWTFIHAIGDNDYSLRAKKRGISSFSTGEFVGSCSINELLPKWCRPEISFVDRVKNLYSPLANSRPDLYFIYELRYDGFLLAAKHFVSIHLRMMIPSLWRTNK